MLGNSFPNPAVSRSFSPLRYQVIHQSAPAPMSTSRSSGDSMRVKAQTTSSGASTPRGEKFSIPPLRVIGEAVLVMPPISICAGSSDGTGVSVEFAGNGPKAVHSVGSAKLGAGLPASKGSVEAEAL